MARQRINPESSRSVDPAPPVTTGDSGDIVAIKESLDSDAERAAAARVILQRMENARQDMSVFFETVVRQETSRAPIKTTPHQDLMFSFIEAHRWCVLRLPVGCSKTYGMGGLTLKYLGEDPTQRGLNVSKTRMQAQKVLSMVKDYIVDPELNAPLALIYPNLQPSAREGDSWKQDEITIQRPAGIRDPSVRAVGLESKTVLGSRVGWLVADDLLDADNTRTPDARQDVESKFVGKFLSRMDARTSRVCVCNTPWHREDLTYVLEERDGWPTLTMDIYGYVRVSNPRATWWRMALNKYLRPSQTRVEMGVASWYRLRAHDPDPDEKSVLFEERWPLDAIEDLRYKRGYLPHEFARQFLCQPMDISSSRCQSGWIEKCKARGVGQSLVSSYDGRNPVYTGLDLAIASGQRNDMTVFVTAEILPDGSRRLLDIESGKWLGPTIVEKIVDKTERYNSVLAVESNAAQDYVRQFALETKKDLRILPHTTTHANKHSLEFGVESIFAEFKNEAWIIPCNTDNTCHPEIQKLIDGCIHYLPPPHHTSDHLMAMWLCREAARKRSSHGDPAPKVGRKREMINMGQF